MYAAVFLRANFGFRDLVMVSVKALHWRNASSTSCLMMNTTVNCRSLAYITKTLILTSSLLSRVRLHSFMCGTFDIHQAWTQFERKPFPSPAHLLHRPICLEQSTLLQVLSHPQLLALILLSYICIPEHFM